VKLGQGYGESPREWLFLCHSAAGQGVRHLGLTKSHGMAVDCKQLERGSRAALFQNQYGQNNKGHGGLQV
jgi:hypothetical protein